MNSVARPPALKHFYAMDPTGRHRGVPVLRYLTGAIGILLLLQITTFGAIVAILLLAALLMRDLVAEH